MKIKTSNDLEEHCEWLEEQIGKELAEKFVAIADERFSAIIEAVSDNMQVFKEQGKSLDEETQRAVARFWNLVAAVILTDIAAGAAAWAALTSHEYESGKYSVCNFAHDTMHAFEDAKGQMCTDMLDRISKDVQDAIMENIAKKNGENN